jgi:hypothetical protein
LVPAPRIIETLDIVEHIGVGIVPYALDLSNCALNDEKKVSIAPFVNSNLSTGAFCRLSRFDSQTLPDGLIEQVTPWSAISSRNWSDVYWPRWTE